MKNEMDCSVYIRRFVAVLLCCVLAFHSALPVAKASDPVTAATLAVTGGQLAGGVLAGEAGAASLAGPVGVVVGLTLGALGVNAYVSKAAQEAGKTRTRFVLDNLVIWGYKAGYAKEQLYKKIAQGISVAADGTIQLSKEVAGMIEQFGNWLFTQEGAVVPSEALNPSSGSVTVGNFQGLAYLPSYEFKNDNGTRLLYSFSSSLACALVRYNSSSYTPIFISDSSFSITQSYFYGSNTTPDGTHNYTSTNSGNLYYFYPRFGTKYSNFSDLPYFDYTASSFISEAISAGGAFNVNTGSVPYDEVFTGTSDSWTENKDVLNPSSDDTSIVLNPDLINPIINSLTDGQQATMSIIDYLQALQDTWDHALDDVQTAIGTITDTLTGIEEQIEITQEAIKNPTITNPSVTPDTTPILNPSDVDPDSVVPGFSFPLDEIFPFCIPFDVVAALELFDVPAEAPSLHVHWELPYNIVFDFDLDLSEYEDVAEILRIMETILFAVGLAVATRSLFIRS